MTAVVKRMRINTIQPGSICLTDDGMVCVKLSHGDSGGAVVDTESGDIIHLDPHEAVIVGIHEIVEANIHEPVTNDL